MNGSSPKPRRASVCASLLLCALAACDSQPNPCTSDESYSGKPVACRAGTNVRILANVATSSEEWTSQIAFSEHRVALDDEYAYWADYKGRILRTPKAGGHTDVLLEASACTIADLAVDDVGVYFGQNCEVPEYASMTNFPVRGSVSWLDKESGERHELAEQKLADVREVTVRDGIVYWTLSNEINSSTLHRVPRDQPIHTDTQVVRANAVYLPFGLSDDRVLWLEGGSKGLRSSPLEGGIGELLTATTQLVEWLAVADDAVSWTERTIIDNGAVERRLFRISVAGGEPIEPLAGLVTEYMATDGTDYYGVGDNSATNQVADRVYRWRAPDYEPEVLAAGLSSPENMAIDDTHVFVLDRELERKSLRLLRVSR